MQYVYDTKTCDFCGKDCGSRYIDGSTRMGPWATMCQWCYLKRGNGLGTGRGQCYDRKDIDGVAYWVKVEG